MKKPSLLLIAVLLTACSAEPKKASSDSSASSLSSASSASSASSFPNPTPTPYTLRLSVPFSPQAPFANWDPLHEEACEEMSLLLVHHYLEGTNLTREQAEAELLALVQWEETHGYPQDVTVAELGRIAEEYFGHHSRVIADPTEEDLKRLLTEGHPVIVPAAGRDLGNPYFSGEGPWYHMLVLTGYGEFFFQTNDVGTRRGENYAYRFPTLMNAIHDWTGVKENIRIGVKRVLVVDN